MYGQPVKPKQRAKANVRASLAQAPRAVSVRDAASSPPNAQEAPQPTLDTFPYSIPVLGSELTTKRRGGGSANAELMDLLRRLVA